MMHTIGAAFGATLYRYFVLLCATRCRVDNETISFIMRLLFETVQGGAGRCWVAKNSNLKFASSNRVGVRVPLRALKVSFQVIEGNDLRLSRVSFRKSRRRREV